MDGQDFLSGVKLTYIPNTLSLDFPAMFSMSNCSDETKQKEWDTIGFFHGKGYKHILGLNYTLYQEIL